MSQLAFDTFTRTAAHVISRRSSLATLGGVALTAGLFAPLAAKAKDNKAKKAKKKARKKCRNQQGQCEASVQTFCNSLVQMSDASNESVSAEGTCIGLLSQCCTFLSTCNASASTNCFLQFVATAV